jgi:hypothetical protein
MKSLNFTELKGNKISILGERGSWRGSSMELKQLTVMFFIEIKAAIINNIIDKSLKIGLIKCLGLQNHLKF